MFLFYSVYVSELELVLEKSSRPDLIFINKHGPVIYDALYTSLQMDSNTVENIESVYTTLALLCVELASAETVIDLLQLVLGYKPFTGYCNSYVVTFLFVCRIQSLALNSTMLSNAQKFNLHAVVATLLVLIPNVVNIPQLADYAKGIADSRKDETPHLLPELLVHYAADCEAASKVPHLLVDQVFMNYCCAFSFWFLTLICKGTRDGLEQDSKRLLTD